jgi:hypothetical protein
MSAVYSNIQPDGGLRHLMLDVFTQTKFEGGFWHEQIDANKEKLPKAFLHELVLRYTDKECGNRENYPEYTSFHERNLCKYHEHHNVHDETTEYFRSKKAIVELLLKDEQAAAASASEENSQTEQSLELQARDDVESSELRPDEVMVESSMADQRDVRSRSQDNKPTGQTDQGIAWCKIL